MKKVFMMISLLLFINCANAQSSQRPGESSKEYDKRLKQENKAISDANAKILWEAEKAERDAMTPEERRRYENTLRMKEQEKQQEKKVNKTGKTSDYWAMILGLNASNILGSNPDYKPVPRGQVGIEIPIISFSDYLGLRLGASYSLQGGKIKSEGYSYTPGGGSSSGNSTSITSRRNYLNLPVLIHYQKAPVGFFAEAGVQPGLLLSAKNKGTTTTNIKDDLKKLDIGIPIGVGYQLKNKIGVGLRITPGLMNVNKDKQFKNRNMVASLRASYAL